MLTYEDEPTIRNAMIKRLDKERGVRIIDFICKDHPDCIKVGLLCAIDGRVIVKSRFDLPTEFEISHLHNEIDEIAEQIKKVRADSAMNTAFERTPVIDVPGTGLRGRWARHGAQ